MAMKTQTSLDSPSRKLISKSISNSILPPADNCLYTPFYCEENVWRFCEYVRRHKISEISNCFVVFISNPLRSIPLWRQKSGKEEDDKLVSWDYHVIFMHVFDDRCLVYDLDSDLPFPTFFPKYVTETLRTDQILPPEHHRFFRVVSAPVYLQKFASDRRHMKDSEGAWLKAPPPTNCIRTSESTHNIDDFISMDPKVGYGTIYNLKEFVSRFYKTQ